MSLHATSQSGATEKEHPKVPEIKTYETAEAAELTKNERKKLSRAMLLKWFQAKKYEKLKGLQEHILELSRTPSDLDAFKEKIIENTRSELAKLNKELTSKEIKKRAEKFGDAIVDVAHGIGNIKTVMEGFASELKDEKMFHEYIGSVGGAVGVINLRFIRNNSEISKFLKTQPALEEELDKAIDSGDYDNVRSVLLKIPKFKGHGDDLDVLLGTLMEQQGPVSGVQGMIETAIKWIGGMPKKALEALKHTDLLLKSKVYKPVAKKLGVDYATLRNVSALTIFQLKDRARVFKKYRGLIEDKRSITKNPKMIKKLEKQLKYIDDVIVIADNVEETKQKHGEIIHDAYERRLEKLRKEGKINTEDKIRILGEMSLDSVKVSAFLPLMNYENEREMKQDSNLRIISLAIGRSKRMKRAFKFLGGGVSIDAAHGIVGIQRLFERNVRKFKKMFGHYPSGNKLTSMFDDLSKKVEAYNSELSSEVAPSEINKRRRTKAYMKDVKGHDDIIRMYYEASQHASKVLSKEAKKVIGAGKELDKLRGKFNPNSIPKSVTDVLYEGGKVPPVLKFKDLEKAYADRLINVRVARDTAQETFAALSEKIKTNVMGEFENKWLRSKDISMGIEDMKKVVQKETGEIKDLLTTKGKAKYIGMKFGLPAIAIGLPIFDVVRNKARYRDIKWDLFDTAIGFVPIAGTINDFKQMLKGRTTSGRKLSFREQVVSGLFGVVGAVSDAAWLLGGLGGVMRAGLGSLRTGRRIAHVGELSKSVKAIHTAEGYGFMQKIGMKIGGLVSGLTTAKMTENFAESAAKVKAYNYLSISKKLRTVEGFDDVKDLKSAERFADALKGTKQAEAAREYAKMLKHTGVDYYKSLSQSFGFTADAPKLLGIKTKFHNTMNYVRRIFLKSKNPENIARFNELERTADAYQAIKTEKLAALEAYRESVRKGEGVEDALKNLKAVEGRFITEAQEYAKVQEEIYATAENISRTHRLVTELAKYASYGGLALGGYYLLTGVSPTAKGISEGTKKVAGGAWGTTKWTLKHAAGTYQYQAPIDDIIDSTVKNRAEEVQIAQHIKEIEDSKDTNKKQAIEAFCAKHWYRDSVRAWVYRHKDKLDIRKILDKAKKLYRPQIRGRVRQAIAKGSEVLGAGKPGVA